jgi:hypothetical protein
MEETRRKYFDDFQSVATYLSSIRVIPYPSRFPWIS